MNIENFLTIPSLEVKLDNLGAHWETRERNGMYESEITKNCLKLTFVSLQQHICCKNDKLIM